jgi:hypothetical protein
MSPSTNNLHEMEEDFANAERPFLKRALKRIDAQLADEESRFSHEAVQRQHRFLFWLHTHILVGPVMVLYRCPNVLFACAMALNGAVFLAIPLSHHGALSHAQTIGLWMLCAAVTLLSAIVSGAKAGNSSVRIRHQQRINCLKAEREKLMDKVLDETL